MYDAETLRDMRILNRTKQILITKGWTTQRFAAGIKALLQGQESPEDKADFDSAFTQAVVDVDAEGNHAVHVR